MIHSENLDNEQEIRPIWRIEKVIFFFKGSLEKYESTHIYYCFIIYLKFQYKSCNEVWLD